MTVRPEVTSAYAVPATVVAVAWPLLREEREVPRSALGVLVQPASEELRHHFCPDCGGQEVLEVAAGGPAALAGVQPMDVILHLDGRPLAPGATLRDALLPYRPGRAARVGVLRGGTTVEVRTLLGRAP
jgi:S1-C subfamily serine protease